MALSFALADAGYENGELSTTAKISLDKIDDGFQISQSALSLTAKIAGIADDEFAKIAQHAKDNCPVSKLLDTRITLDVTLENS